MKDSGIRPMKGILWPTNALQYQWETKRKKTVFSQYTKKKKRKEVHWSYFHFCWFGNAFLWYGTQLTPIDSGRGFIIKVKTVEIWPNSTITVDIPPALASLFISIMGISIPGTENEIPARTEGMKGCSLICSKTKQKRNEWAVKSC